MTNRKHSATTNAGEGTSSQEQVNALYTAHQVHTLANLIYRRMTSGSAAFGNAGTQPLPAGHAGVADGAHGYSPNAWYPAGAAGSGSSQDMNAGFGAMHGGTMNNTVPFDFASYGAMQAAGSGYGFHPYFGAQTFGVHPYFAAQNASAMGSPFGYTGGFGAPGFANFNPTSNPYFAAQGFGTGNNPYFAAQGFGGAQSPFGFNNFSAMNAPCFAPPSMNGMNNAFPYMPYATMYGMGMNNPYGFMPPHWMYANQAAMPGPYGFMPHWGTPAGSAMQDASGCMNAACTPRNPGFSPAPALFYWYP